MIKPFIVGSALLLAAPSWAGSHGTYSLSCTSDSLRTHLLMELNDHDFADEALFPQRIILSVMGHMRIFDKNTGPRFRTINNNGLLTISSTDRAQSHVFEVDFNKRATATVTIKQARNPRNEKVFSGLTLNCKKSHDL